MIAGGVGQFECDITRQGPQGIKETDRNFQCVACHHNYCHGLAYGSSHSQNETGKYSRFRGGQNDLENGLPQGNYAGYNSFGENRSKVGALVSSKNKERPGFADVHDERVSGICAADFLA